MIRYPVQLKDELKHAAPYNFQEAANQPPPEQGFHDHGKHLLSWLLTVSLAHATPMS